MELQFFGGAQTVTGSQHLLSVNGKTILLECGLFQGRRSDTYEKNLNFEYDPADVDAMILSHAHIDHSGNIPNFFRKGFKGPIHATPATIDLAHIMLRDSAYLNEKDAEWVNKRRKSKGQEPIEPLYTSKDAAAALELFQGQQYYKPFKVCDGVTATFQDAGHILGSAGVLLEIDEGGKKTRLGFSGDIGRHDVPILRDPDTLKDVDILIIESTYGNRLHEPVEDAEAELAEVINRVYKRGGKLIIPAFAIGRTQLLVYMMHTLQERGLVPNEPIYVDSPMACNATDVFRDHPDIFDKDAYNEFIKDNEDPFAPEGFACIRDVAGSKRLNEVDDPMIIISASGMMEGGRVLHHLRNNIDDPKNMLLFVGFAAENTLARRLKDGAKQVRIFGEEYDVKIDIEEMTFFSGHADQAGLMNAVKRTPPDKLKQIFLVHGELEPQEVFKGLLNEAGYDTVHIPKRLDSYTI